MLKRIRIDQVRKGMHIHDLCGSWMEHPFWKTNFALNSDKDLVRLRDSSIRELWIDTALGLDVEDADAAARTSSEAQVRAEAEVTLANLSVAPPAPASYPLDSELAHAARLCAKAKTAVTSMFQEARMGQAVNFVDAEPLVDEISASVMRNPGALISLARLKEKDDYTYMHSVAVCALMIALARQLGLDADTVRQAGMGGLLHDLGKSAIPLDILNKPGKLTDQEFRTVKDHPEVGHRLLIAGGRAGEIPLDVCLHHHEKTDGSGYPHRLTGDQISLFAKMGAVCDIYDAITSDRPYKAGWDPAESLRRMAEWSAGHFDEKVFHAFVKSVGIYPIGSLVRLESGLLGIVASQGPDSLLKPAVRTFYSVADRRHIEPRLTELFRPGNADRIVSVENAANWGLGDLNHLWTGGEPRAMAT
jgi:putative nucleotidyltransferase with HDIG domain